MGWCITLATEPKQQLATGGAKKHREKTNKPLNCSSYPLKDTKIHEDSTLKTAFTAEDAEKNRGKTNK
jgi:hypothetical protein